MPQGYLFLLENRGLNCYTTPSFDRMGKILGEEGIISLTDGRGSPKISNNETDPVLSGSRTEHCVVLRMAGGTRVFFVRPLDFHFTG